MRLLLAEDERELSDALCAILKHNHYSVDPVYDGQDALDYLRHGQYDGAILDIMMPKIDGLSVLHRVREAVSYTHLPNDRHWPDGGLWAGGKNPPDLQQRQTGIFASKPAESLWLSTCESSGGWKPLY